MQLPWLGGSRIEETIWYSDQQIAQVYFDLEVKHAMACVTHMHHSDAVCSQSGRLFHSALSIIAHAGQQLAGGLLPHLNPGPLGPQDAG